MQKYTIKQLLEILEDDNFEYDYHDCSVGNTNRQLAKIILKSLDEKYTLIINTEDEYSLDRIINTFTRSYNEPYFEESLDRSTRKFNKDFKESNFNSVEEYTNSEYIKFTVSDIKNLIEELKNNKDSEVYKYYNNIISFLNKISEDKDDSFYHEYHKCLLDSKYSHIIKDFINKYLKRYYFWSACNKTYVIENLDNGKNIVDEFKNKFEIYLPV